MKKLIILITAVLFAAACGGAGNTSNSGSANNTATAKATATPEAKPAVTLKPGEVPFDGMSNVATTAKAGEIVLTIDTKKAEEIASKPTESHVAIFNNRKMNTPGEVESEVEDSFKDKYKIANAYIIALPKGQKAKVGDIVLTWWQSGGGMMRGYVTEAANPAEPTVRYLDMTPADDKSDKLKPDTFIVVKGSFDPGSIVAVKNAGGKMDNAMILRVNGDKVLVQGFGRKLMLVNKADLTPVPNKPDFKAGDKVKAAFFASYEDAIVVSVDAATGKVTVKKETNSEEKTLDFGDVYKG